MTSEKKHGQRWEEGIDKKKRKEKKRVSKGVGGREKSPPTGTEEELGPGRARRKELKGTWKLRKIFV